MNQKAIEIQIYFEIAMAIGTSLDLRTMLQTALSAYLRKLICTTGVILELRTVDGDQYHYAPCFSIPRKAIDNPLIRTVRERLPERVSQAELEALVARLPEIGQVDSGHHYHLMLLPGFGLLLLVRSGQPLDFRTIHSLKQLNRKLADSCLSCLQNEQLEAVNSRLNHEIEQRRQAEDRLKELLATLEDQVAERTRDLEESRMRYKNLFDNIQDIYFSLTEEGQIIEISPSVTATLGYSRADLIGRALSDLGFARTSMEELIAATQRRQSLKNYPFVIRAADQSLHHFSLNATLTTTPSGQPARIVGSLRDVTQLHLARQAQQRLEEQLETSRKMEALGLLAGGVAHDLNNVLSGIVSYPDLLLTMLEEDSKLRLPITVIRDSGAKAAAIVQDLLTMARRSVVQKEVVNLNQLINEYLASPEHQKLRDDHAGVSVLTKLNPELLNQQGSPHHLKNALMNLVLNSVEAGADLIVISTDNRYIESGSWGDRPVAEGEYVLFCITDNGSGIALEDQARIFEPFYTKKRMGRSGTGLGMAVVWGTVEDHGGTITIDSEPGQSTTFHLLLPATRQPLPSQQTRPARLYSGNGERVLVVDDSRDQRRIARAALESMGYTVQTVASGEEAIKVLAGGKLPGPDVILLDMLMEPGMDGLDTYRRIQHLQPEQRVIIVSGYSETGRVKEALTLGARCYLRKPYLLNSLGEALHQVLADPARS